MHSPYKRLVIQHGSPDLCRILGLNPHDFHPPSSQLSPFLPQKLPPIKLKMPLSNMLCAGAYLKLDKEDLEEVSHRRALFLIYKAMEQADSMTRSRPSCLFLRMRFPKEKLRIGKRLRKLRKGVSSMLSGVRFGSHDKGVAKKAKASWIQFLRHKDEKIAAIPTLLV